MESAVVYLTTLHALLFGLTGIRQLDTAIHISSNTYIIHVHISLRSYSSCCRICTVLNFLHLYTLKSLLLSSLHTWVSSSLCAPVSWSWMRWISLTLKARRSSTPYLSGPRCRRHSWCSLVSGREWLCGQDEQHMFYSAKDTLLSCWRRLGIFYLTGCIEKSVTSWLQEVLRLWSHVKYLLMIDLCIFILVQ